jgi:hypothetical protein
MIIFVEETAEPIVSADAQTLRVPIMPSVQVMRRVRIRG